MRMNSRLSWRIIFIGIPLIPFFLGGLIKFITISLTCDFTWKFYEIIKTLYLSWDTVAFSFSISIMAFIVKNHLVNVNIPLTNADKESEVSGASGVLFVFGVLNLVFFGVLLLTHTRLFNCSDNEFVGAHIFFSIIIYLLAFLTIKSVVSVQRKFNLTSNIVF